MIQRNISWEQYRPRRLPLEQCRAFPECENVPGPGGYCHTHPRERKQVRMTPAEIRTWWETRSLDDLKRLLEEFGVGEIGELASLRLSVSVGGAVVCREDLGNANEAFSETLPGKDD